MVYIVNERVDIIGVGMLFFTPLLLLPKKSLKSKLLKISLGYQDIPHLQGISLGPTFEFNPATRSFDHAKNWTGPRKVALQIMVCGFSEL